MPDTLSKILEDNRPWGWEAHKIDGIWCVGMWGNLDTIHDAALKITGGFFTDQECERLAKWIAKQLNDAAGITDENRPEVKEIE